MPQLEVTWGNSSPPWTAIEAISTGILALITALSLPVLIIQAWLSRKVHVEEVIGRLNEKLFETRSSVRRLNERRISKVEVTSETIWELKTVSARLSSCLPAIRAETRLLGAKSIGDISKFLLDVELVTDYTNYVNESCQARLSLFKNDAIKVLDNVMVAIGASEEDAATARKLMSERHKGKELSQLLEAIALKHLAAQGASAEEIANFQRTGVAPFNATDDMAFFSEYGGDASNVSTLEFWFAELREVEYDLKELLRVAREIVTNKKKQANSVILRLRREKR